MTDKAVKRKREAEGKKTSSKNKHSLIESEISSKTPKRMHINDPNSTLNKNPNKN